jgi:DNA repair exonuclease SbcCD nuclease subunit
MPPQRGVFSERGTVSKPYGLLADLHLHPWSMFSVANEHGVNSRLVGLLWEIHRAAEAVHKAGGDTLVFAGDVFHVRGSVAPTVLNATKDMLYRCHSSFGTQFVIIPGNHDLEGKNSTRLGSAVTALEDSYVAVRNETCIDPHLNAALIPWFESVTQLKEELERQAPAEKGAYDAIIHAPIDGVIPGLPMHGLDPEYLAQLGYRRIFAGHYHNHKRMHPGVAMGDPATDPRYYGEVYSIGALAHHTWSDVGTQAGFLMVRPNEVQFSASHLPQFLDLTRLTEVEPDELPMLVDKNYVRVRVEASKIKDVEAARAELLKMGAAGVLVQAEPKPAAEMARVGVATIKSGASLEVSVGDFIKSMKDIDPAAVATEAMAVLGSVKEEA